MRLQNWMVLYDVYKVLGFTLIELMVTIAVLAIIAMVAAPSFGTTLSNQQLKKNTMELKTTLQEARSQSLLSRAQSVVCLSKNNLDVVVTKEDCAKKLPDYDNLTLTAAFKNTNVFIVTRDNKIDFDSSNNDDFFTFDNRGKAVPKILKLCSSNHSYTLTLSVAGTIEIRKEDGC